MQYIYGPIRSRRLGFSLGISLTPYKICNFDCIYCQLGRTRNLTYKREKYVKAEDIIEEIKIWLDVHSRELNYLNYLTISGFGEPTLNTEIGRVIQEIKKISSLSLALITNSSLLGDPQVRRDIVNVDLIIPSLDAVNPLIFNKINRPYSEIKIEKIIEGLIMLKKETKAKIWLEIMLVKRVNDDLRHIKRLREIIELINPDKIQLNSPVRNTAESQVFPLDKMKLEKIKEVLGVNCEII